NYERKCYHATKIVRTTIKIKQSCLQSSLMAWLGFDFMTLEQLRNQNLVLKKKLLISGKELNIIRKKLFYKNDNKISAEHVKSKDFDLIILSIKIGHKLQIAKYNRG
ncbi:hypothetical protein BpHYR1_052010, partial [Brachionus plicatilis]